MNSTLSKTLKNVLEATAGYLDEHGVENPRLAGELLAARLLDCKRLDLYLRLNAPLENRFLEAMRRGVRRVAAGEPVQYVLGQTEFMGHTLKVDPRALIPRPETEQLVERVLACEPLWAQARPAVADVGTGCGCIAIALAAARPDGLYLALDTSADAVSLARENAEAIGLPAQIGFGVGTLSDVVEPETLDAVVANPPYVSSDDFEKLPVHIREHEPRMALDGGKDGLRVAEAIFEEAGLALKAGGRLFMEIGAAQAARVTALMTHWGFEQASVARDLAGRDRVVEAVLS